MRISNTIIVIFLSILFVLFSFVPSFNELVNRENLPPSRTFVLEHNYMFDYNFYLSRIREGREGRLLISEKYYSEPHGGSLFQIVYLYMGKIGGIFSFEPPTIYHLGRIVFGFSLLLMTGLYCNFLFKGRFAIIAFLFSVTLGSFPVLLWVQGIPRFGTYMGWWSAIDSLQRITFLPHILIGQMGILFFIRQFTEEHSVSIIRLCGLGVIGFIVGLVFPPTLIVVYVFFGIFDLLIFSTYIWQRHTKQTKLLFKEFVKEFFVKKLIPQIVFFAFSFPVFIYLNLMFEIMPWKALALFDIEHRITLDYREYALALGPLFPIGVLGMVWIFIKKDVRFYPLFAWIVSVFILFRIFENIPQQSPSRFTEAALQIPLGILAAYFFWQLLDKINGLQKRLLRIARISVFLIIVVIILTGLGVMASMIGWLTDQAYAKRVGTFAVPIGAQLAYPLDDFMDGIYYLRDNTKQEKVVLSYITAGNFIPAYAGNFVYLGHANTPDENWKELESARFFKGHMTREEAEKFLQTHHISYVYFGIAEKELGGLTELSSHYPNLLQVYQNNSVIIYSVQ